MGRWVGLRFKFSFCPAFRQRCLLGSFRSGRLGNVCVALRRYWLVCPAGVLSATPLCGGAAVKVRSREEHSCQARPSCSVMGTPWVALCSTDHAALLLLTSSFFRAFPPGSFESCRARRSTKMRVSPRTERVRAPTCYGCIYVRRTCRAYLFTGSSARCWTRSRSRSRGSRWFRTSTPCRILTRP